ITPADWRKGERVWKPPQGAVQSRACRAVAMAKAGPLGPDSLLYCSPLATPSASGGLRGMRSLEHFQAA
ncbi:MAG: hypothetical protein PVH08_11950, partial [Syntrophobacterales bacterium]